jgi:hypothetical protein
MASAGYPFYPEQYQQPVLCSSGHQRHLLIAVHIFNYNNYFYALNAGNNLTNWQKDLLRFRFSFGDS